MFNYDIFLKNISNYNHKLKQKNLTSCLFYLVPILLMATFKDALMYAYMTRFPVNASIEYRFQLLACMQ